VCSYERRGLMWGEMRECWQNERWSSICTCSLWSCRVQAAKQPSHRCPGILTATQATHSFPPPTRADHEAYAPQAWAYPASARLQAHAIGRRACISHPARKTSFDKPRLNSSGASRTRLARIAPSRPSSHRNLRHHSGSLPN
jgi:hypothetical protein